MTLTVLRGPRSRERPPHNCRSLRVYGRLYLRTCRPPHRAGLHCVGPRVLRARSHRAVIVVLSPDQLQAIEDALESALLAMLEGKTRDPLLRREVYDALQIVRATRELATA
jgi:hypothetical protein